jgi:hypothetical protein
MRPPIHKPPAPDESLADLLRLATKLERTRNAATDLEVRYRTEKTLQRVRQQILDARERR